VLIFLPLLFVPVAVAVGVMRYRLLGIESVLRRGLVYGMFTMAVVGAYLLVTAIAGAALDRRPLPGVVAAALVALALAPARGRLQRAADRLVYGERSDPLRALTLLGQRVAATGELDLLPGAVASVLAAVRAPSAELVGPDGRILVRVEAGPGGRLLAGAGAEPGVDGGPVLPLRFGGQLVGELRVAPRGVGETYSTAEARLLAALALQVAVVVRAVDLTQALEAERDRVVDATRTERDRLRADLHDGLGPSLSGVGLGLQALADTLYHNDRSASTALLDRIRDEVTLAFGEVRRIIDGLQPTALDTLRLPDAIRRHAETISATLPVHVEATELPPLSPQVENAAYRITTEALTNAARHAEAREVGVTLTAAEGALRITVSDDGRGVGTPRAGIGLTSMRNRAEALGGRLQIASAADGTTITATLPLQVP
jgi:signal transduction histidine kinase